MKQMHKIVSTLAVLGLVLALVAIPAPRAGADGLSPTPGWSYDGAQSSARLGRCVAAGDFDGDGYDDVVVGEYWYDSGSLSNAGRVLAFYGSASGPSTTPGWTQTGDRDNMYLGSSCANLGDVNGDGIDDLIAGAESYTGGASYEGAAFVYYGSAAGLPSTPSWMAEGDNAGAHFGGAVAAAGDVDGDGYRDVLVGASDYTNGESQEGRAFLYYGSASGPSTAPDWTAEADLATADFGRSVAGADVNGDGYSDVIVGSPWYTNGEYREGIAVLYYGSAAGPGPSGTPANADWLVEGNQAQAELGGAVALAGDVNADGYDDVALGADQYDNGHTDEGMVYVYYGSASGLGATADWTAEADQNSARMGFSLAHGDVNGDGVDDLLVGAYAYTAGQTAEGAAFVYRGSTTGLGPDGTPDNADWMGESDQAVAYFGWSVAAGDVDGDGFGDVLVGAPDYDTGSSNTGRASLYLGQHVALTVAKSGVDLNGGDLRVGDVVEYTIVVANDSAASISGVSVNDIIPANTTYVPGSANPPTSPPVNGLLRWTNQTVAADSAATYTFRVTVNGDTIGQMVSNTAEVREPEQPPALSPAAVLGPVAAHPYQISKAAADLNGAPLAEGDMVEYTITVTNGDSLYPLTGLVVTDAIPAWTTYVAGSAAPPQTSGPAPLVWSGQVVPAGGAATYVFRVQVDAGSAGQAVTNAAGADGPGVEPADTGPVEPPGGGTVVPTGELQIGKVAEDLSGPPLYEGDVVEYTITITNSGAIARTDVVVTDTIPAGTTYVPGSADPPQASGPDPLVWTLSSLGGGASSAFTFRVTVDPGTVGQTVENQAEVDSDQDEGTVTPPVTPPDGGTVRPPLALQIGKTAEDLDGAPLVEGDVIEYTITVTNPTTYPADDVTVTDTIPACTTYVQGSAAPPQTSGPDPLVWSGQTVPAGGSAAYTFRVEVDAGAAGQTVVNIAQVGGTNVAPTGTLPVEPPGGGTVLPIADIEIAKVAEDLNGAPLYEGDVVEYTITITNPGAVAHTGVLVGDAIPYGTTYMPGSAVPPQTSGPDPLVWNAGALEPGATRTFSFRVTVDAGTAGGQIGGNVAGVTSDQQSVPAVNPPAWPPGGGTVEPLPDLQIRKTAEDLNGAPLYEGDVIEYTVVVSNTSSGAATGVAITDTVPVSTTYVAGSATTTQGTITGPDPLVVNVGTLAAGGRVTVTFRVTVNAGTAGQTVENQAQVGSDQSPPVITPPVVPPGGPGTVAPYLTIVKVGGDVNGPPLLAGDQVEYHVLVFNPAPVTATRIAITDYVPAGATYVPGSASTTRGALSGPDPLVVDVDEQPALSTTFVKFRVTVDPVVALTTITNTATAAVAGCDPVTAQAVLGPVGGDNVGLVIGKIAADVNGPPLYEGDEIEYTIGLANTDDTPHANIVVTDAIPYGTTYVTGSAAPAPAGAPDPLVWTVKSLPAKEIRFFTFRVVVNGGMAGQQIGGNVAVADSDEQDEPVQTAPVYPGSVQGYVQPGDLSLVKTAVDVDGAPLYEGDVVRYTITVTNDSTDTTHTNVVVEDSIPMSTTYVAGSGTPAPDSGPDPLVWRVASLAPGEGRTFTFRVTVNEGTVGQHIGGNVAVVHSDQAPPVITPPVLPPDPEVVEPDTGHYYYLPLMAKDHVIEPPPPPGGDEYEPDNTCSQATPLTFGAPQTHTFDPRGDVDWVSFPMVIGRTYIIQTGELIGGADTILQLYAGDCIVLLAENDDHGGNLWSRIEWQATATGTFYARIRNYDPTVGGEGMSYAIGVQELP